MLDANIFAAKRGILDKFLNRKASKASRESIFFGRNILAAVHQSQNIRGIAILINPNVDRNADNEVINVDKNVDKVSIVSKSE